MANQRLDEGCFFFDSEDPIYADHFPGKPVVPGSLIVHAFLTAASAPPFEAMPRGVENFRFKRFISPGRYAYRIQRETNGDLSCMLLDGQTAVVTGRLSESIRER